MKTLIVSNQNPGSKVALDFMTGQPLSIAWNKGVFTQVKPATNLRSDTSLPWCVPGLVDPQINGFAGVDFQQDDLTLKTLEGAAHALVQQGCLSFFPTLITDEWNKMLTRLKHLTQLKSQSVLLQKTIAGWHLEGPFLSVKPGFRGAHPAQHMLNPQIEKLREIRKATQDLVLLTLAPECEGAIEAIREAVSLGFVVSAGHSDASAWDLEQAIQAGLSSFTHLANGCPQELDRHDNILWRVLDQKELMASVIPDGIHVSPTLFRLLHRTLGKRMFCTTDAMSAAGAPPGPYTLGPLKVEVGQDRIVRQPGATNFAGSALTPLAGVQQAAHMLGCTWQEAWPLFSTLPARWLHLNDSPTPAPGHPARFCLLSTDPHPDTPSGLKVEQVVF